VLVQPETARDRIRFFQTVGGIVGGSALLFGLYFTAQTLQVNCEGQITERFTRAIDQLGSKELEIRLGGIYALERIPRDSERDHWPIMEVLTAYVRQHAPWRPEEEQKGTGEAAVEKKSTEDSSEQSEPAKVPTLDLDIQAIVTVLQRRTRSLGHGEPGILDLHETNLSGANLYRVDLRGANLGRANLSRAHLWSANLSYFEDREHIFMTDLSGANLRGADLEGTDLRRAHLEGAHLEGANLSGPYGGRANLEDVNLRGADLSGSNLEGVNLSGANLSNADLTGGDLRDTNLSGAYKMKNANTKEETKQLITEAELEAQTRLLEGATMPDGSKHP
jgi:hypothetical protein